MPHAATCPEASKHSSPHHPNKTCFDDFNSLCLNEVDMTSSAMNDTGSLIANLYVIFRKLRDAGYLRYFIDVVKVAWRSMPSAQIELFTLVHFNDSFNVTRIKS